MEHGEIHQKLSAYLDNDLSVEEKEEIKGHLGSCGSCRVALASLELLIGSLRSIPEVEPPPWLTTQIMAKVRAAAEPKPAFWRRFLFPLRVKLPFALTIFVLFCATGYYLARTNNPRHVSGSSPAPHEQVVRRSGEAVGVPVNVNIRPSQPLRPTPGAISPEYPVALRTMDESPRAVLPPKVSSLPSLPESSPAAAREQDDEDEPGLQGADDEFVVAGGAGRLLAGDKRKLSAGLLPVEKVEVVLQVDEPEIAAGAIEQAVARLGGTIRGRASGAHSFLSAQIVAQRIPELLTRLGQIGKFLERPKPVQRQEVAVDMVIRW